MHQGLDIEMGKGFLLPYFDVTAASGKKKKKKKSAFAEAAQTSKDDFGG